jgi:hypothetical protein
VLTVPVQKEMGTKNIARNKIGREKPHYLYKQGPLRWDVLVLSQKNKQTSVRVRGEREVVTKRKEFPHGKAVSLTTRDEYGWLERYYSPSKI